MAAPVNRRLTTTATGLLLAFGAGLLVRPRATADALLDGAAVPPSPVIRVLGARQTLQQLVLLAWPGSGVATAAAGVDVLHALSMGAAALAWPQYRRAALTSAGVAAGSALLDVALARSARRTDSLWRQP